MFIKIDGCIETEKTHDEFLEEFITWIESRKEYFTGTTKKWEDEDNN